MMIFTISEKRGRRLKPKGVIRAENKAHAEHIARRMFGNVPHKVG